MPIRYRALVSALLLIFMCATPLSAQENAGTDEFWIIWERELSAIEPCEEEDCSHSITLGHFIGDMEPKAAQKFFSGLGRFAAGPGDTHIRLPENALCFAGDAHDMPDPTTLERADKVDTLRGLTGVHVDLRGVRGPQSFKGSFGERAQAFMLRIFEEHDIPILTKEAAQASPGNAVLSMRYSSEVHGCRPWSVSLSLSQRLLVARMPELLLEGSTWSAAARQNEANVDFDEEQAMEQVIIAFAHAWSEVNDPDWVPPEETN